MDTTAYTYSADGFLNSGLISNYDTVWYTTNGIPQTSVVRTQGTLTHTIAAGNLARSFEVDQIHQVDGSPTATVIKDMSNEITRTFDYAQSYSNKTDFSNAAIATATTWFSEAPVNKNYQNLPDKISEVYITKDQNGTIIGNYPSEITYQFTYNADGLLLTNINTVRPGRVMSYVYGTP